MWVYSTEGASITTADSGSFSIQVVSSSTSNDTTAYSLRSIGELTH
jgi:hypothetical protein